MTDELLFLPLGGAGEIGMNLNLYGYGPAGKPRWLMVDLGVTFENSPIGSRVVLPDPGFIEKHRDDLEGIILTHAHEDHLGAVPYLWERLRRPVYATAFTASILRRKLERDGYRCEGLKIIQIPLSGRVKIGPFDLELITLTHSIPEPNAIVIRTPAGVVLHTGDWKFDPDPVVGPTSDIDALRRVGEEGVLAIVCDSTNVFTPGTSGSEADLLKSLTHLIGECRGRVAVTCFASNVARIETIAGAAAANGRDVVLCGPSLWRFNEAARENGYLTKVPAFISEEDAGYLPDEKTVVICTGSQGEPQAALSRIAEGTHPYVSLREGDTVIFSSRVIPGNETSIARVQNNLVGRNVRIITWEEHLVHVSGHPARDELVEMYGYVRPRIAVPVHGEVRHLAEHARLAQACQVPQAIVAGNGALVRLAGGTAGIIDQVPAGRLYVESGRVISDANSIMRERSRVAFNGAATVTVVVDLKGRLLADPQLATIALVDKDDEATRQSVVETIRATIEDLSQKRRRDDNALSEAVRLAVRRRFRDICGKRPVTQVHLVRVPAGREEESR
jgi:ribonuclease J